MSSDYRLSPALAARLVGLALMGIAVLVFAATLVVGATDAPPWILLLVAVSGVVIVGVAGYVVTRRIAVVHLDERGYRVRLVRGAGVTSAGWAEVEDVVTAERQGSPCLVLRLRDGRTTTIPVELLAADRDEFVRDLRRHLRGRRG
ncbi:MAG: hypothetical protein ACRDOM_05600 [Nocardioides sp.]